MTRVVITAETFLPDAALGAFADARNESAGALASFVGYCRTASVGGAVRALELEHYPGFTEAEVLRLADSVAQRHDLTD